MHGQHLATTHPTARPPTKSPPAVHPQVTKIRLKSNISKKCSGTYLYFKLILIFNSSGFCFILYHLVCTFLKFILSTSAFTNYILFYFNNISFVKLTHRRKRKHFCSRFIDKCLVVVRLHICL